MATNTVPAADRRPLRGHQAEPIAQRIENITAICLILSETQSEDEHITHLARVILEQLRAARAELDALTVGEADHAPVA